MKESVKIIITGDTHLGGGRVAAFAKMGDADQLFGEFLPMFRDVELSVTNLESPVVDGGSPIEKTGPNLKSPVGSLGVLKKAGFGLATLANNHILDYGMNGLQSTLDECSKNGLEVVGAGMNKKEASAPFYTEISGIKIAILNIAENEFGTTQNGEPGGYGMDPIENFYAIRQAKEKADRVIVIVHGGHEHYELPSPRMKKTYRFYVDAGADVVVGHHPHCLSGYELYQNVPIFYSLGNFLFDRNEGEDMSGWNRGAMLKLTLKKNETIEFELIPYIQGGERAGIRELTYEEEEVYRVDLSKLNRIIRDDRLLQDNFQRYCERSSRMYRGYVEPYSSRVLHVLRNRNLFPSVLSKHKKRLLSNLIRCEAHRDILIKTLTS